MRGGDGVVEVSAGARGRARARAEACDRESADDCERCVLRALGRGARGRGNRNDNDRDDAVEDEATFESDGAITLDRAVEFSMYVDETHAIDSDCKFLVSMFKAEMASRALESFSTLLAEAQREAKARAEEITVALAEIDEAARRNARDVEQAAMALDKVRRDQLEFATRFETFAANLNAALDRVERASRGALRAARFAAELAKRCAGIVSETFASLVSVEMIFVRFVIIALGSTRPALRRAAFTALLVEWMLRAAPRSAATTPSNRLRLGLLCAFAPRIWTHARDQLHYSRRVDAETSRDDVGAKPRSGRRARARRLERDANRTVADDRIAASRQRAPPRDEDDEKRELTRVERTRDIVHRRPSGARSSVNKTLPTQIQIHQPNSQPPRTRRLEMSPRITELCSYPVKSCAGVSLEACALTSTGLAFDRLFCVVNAADGKFISQRSHPRLSLVACAIEPPDAFTDRTVRQFALTCETSSMATKLRVEVDLDDASGTARRRTWSVGSGAGKRRNAATKPDDGSVSF